MKAKSQFNNMIKSMPLWLKFVLILLSTIWLILLVWAAIPRTKCVEEQVVINQYQVLDFVLNERLKPSRDSLVVLYEKIVDVQSQVDSLQRELNKCIIKTQQVLGVPHKINLYQPQNDQYSAQPMLMKRNKQMNDIDS